MISVRPPSIRSPATGTASSRAAATSTAASAAPSRPGLDIPLPGRQSQDNIPSLDQFTQEVRIASNNSGGLGYQAGIFYFNENLDIETFDFLDADRDRLPSRSSTSARTAKALGIFGSVNYKFDSGLTLQAGARWNHDKKKLVAEREFDLRSIFVGGGPVDPSPRPRSRTAS